MAKVRILVGVAGADFSWAPGDVVEMSEKSAEAWCDGERAVRVEPRGEGRKAAGPKPEKTPKKPPEKTTQNPPEQATPPTPETTTREAPEQR